MKFMYLLTVLVVIMFSCSEEDAQPVLIQAEVPAAIKVGEADTLKFIIRSESNLTTVELKEGNASYLILDWRTLGKFTREYSLNMLYNPASPGLKAMELLAGDGIHLTRYAFTIQAVE